ncbi:hypothetical protein SAMN04488105_107272 [Salipiger thiooxidans]|uniref:Uncharacterized protein n=1 Tax=Salipiger thiooxidans TaxID=282683 RepID=A0A1G7FSR0_9RHOB|nr:hypothetical protein SAMN04488105_107272 [Salipiger thiooxidans]
MIDALGLALRHPRTAALGRLLRSRLLGSAWPAPGRPSSAPRRHGRKRPGSRRSAPSQRSAAARGTRGNRSRCAGAGCAARRCRRGPASRGRDSRYAAPVARCSSHHSQHRSWRRSPAPSAARQHNRSSREAGRHRRSGRRSDRWRACPSPSNGARGSIMALLIGGIPRFRLAQQPDPTENPDGRRNIHNALGRHRPLRRPVLLHRLPGRYPAPRRQRTADPET